MQYDSEVYPWYENLRKEEDKARLWINVLTVDMISVYVLLMSHCRTWEHDGEGMLTEDPRFLDYMRCIFGGSTSRIIGQVVIAHSGTGKPWCLNLIALSHLCLSAILTWSRWFGQLEGLVKVYSDCEITPSSSSAPALTGGCHGWHEAGSYPVIDDDDALWNCGNLAAGAQAWAAALAREISNGLWAPASPPSGFSATVSGRPQAGQVHIAGWDMVLGPLMR